MVTALLLTAKLVSFTVEGLVFINLILVQIFYIFAYKIKIFLTDCVKNVLEGTITHNIEGSSCFIEENFLVCDKLQNLKVDESKPYFISFKITFHQNLTEISIFDEFEPKDLWHNL